MSSYLRFHRGQNVDCIVPSAVGIEPAAPSSDVVWELSGDINPSKVIQVTQNVQATDPRTGALLYNADGTPKWETKTVTNTDGSTSTEIVTAQVNETVYLQSAPQYFTPSDIQTACTNAGVTFNVVGSLAQAQADKIAELQKTFVETLSAGFTSSADGTSRTYGFAASDQQNIEQQTADMNAGIATWPAQWADKAGNPVSLTQTQFVQLDKDATTFKWNNVNNLRTKCGQVKPATTVAAVNAISY